MVEGKKQGRPKLPNPVNTTAAPTSRTIAHLGCTSPNPIPTPETDEENHTQKRPPRPHTPVTNNQFKM